MEENSRRRLATTASTRERYMGRNQSIGNDLSSTGTRWLLGLLSARIGASTVVSARRRMLTQYCAQRDQIGCPLGGFFAYSNKRCLVDGFLV